MTIVEVPIDQLNPATYNPRKMTEKQERDLTDSITKFGLVDPIIVNNGKGRKNVVIGGHQRLKIAKIQGFNTVPVHYVKLDEKDERELNLRLNKNNGEWDWDILKDFDKELLQMVGFDDKDLLKYFPLEVNEDDAPEPPKKPKSKIGDLFQLGNHRLLCGDATRREDVERLMDGQKADMVFTDPPYGQGFDIEGDTKDKYVAIFTGALDLILVNALDNIYICCNYSCIGRFAVACEDAGLRIYDKIVWYKNLFGQGTLYHRQHEDILFVGHGDYLKDNRNNDVDVWQEDSMRNFAGNKTAKEDVGHPTQKPVAIPARAIKNSSRDGQTVLDLFGGSGSTLIACEQLNRRCFMAEIDGRYVDVILKRWMKLTGKMAYRIGDANESLHKEPVSCAELGITP